MGAHKLPQHVGQGGPGGLRPWGEPTRQLWVGLCWQSWRSDPVGHPCTTRPRSPRLAGTSTRQSHGNSLEPGAKAGCGIPPAPAGTPRSGRSRRRSRNTVTFHPAGYAAGWGKVAQTRHLGTGGAEQPRHLPPARPGGLGWPGVPGICQVGWQGAPGAGSAPDPPRGSAQRVLPFLLLPREGSQAEGPLLPRAVPHSRELCLAGGPPTPPSLCEVRPCELHAGHAEPGAPG